ncbi:MAG TPA: nucleoside monophosphate kinase [Gemmataceae bacterium]|nr:nucleoside monophosphate kinase [Gemmataceae bacterium]
MGHPLLNPDDLRPEPDPGLEVKDAQLIFSAVWDDVLEKYGRDNLRFPREFIWLGGAPGAGKGTNTPFITKTRDITAPPIVISGLLSSPQAVAIKNAGKMVGDREVISLLFQELLKPEYHDGVIVDGFPRTSVQGECLQLFYRRMLELHAAYQGTPLAQHFRKPSFRIALLYVSGDVSVQRQLKRGREIQEYNQRVRETGVGKLLEERPTDLNPDLCRKRYQTFMEETFAALEKLRKIFHFHFIDAEGDLPEVQRNIVQEFGYQSKLDLSDEVFALVRNIPEARQLAVHARQELVERLEDYAETNRAKFEKVVKLVEEKMIPIVRAHAMSGNARINNEDQFLDDPLILKMMIDVFSERGFHASVDVHKMDVPERIDLTTGQITCRTKKVFRIEVRFPHSDIRRGH